MSAAWWEAPLVGFDLETTGPDPETALIVSACVVATIPYSTLWDRTWLIDPDVEIPAEATAVHGITTEQAHADGIPADVAVHEIITELAAAWARGIPLVAFNAAYDFTVLDREARRHGFDPLVPAVVVDPYVLDKHLDPYRKGKRTLTAECAHYGVELTDAHDAGADALAAVGLARAIGRRAPLPAPEVLHAAQVRWRAEQCASLADYFARQGKPQVVRGEWPILPVLVEVLA